MKALGTKTINRLTGRPMEDEITEDENLAARLDPSSQRIPVAALEMIEIKVGLG
jgi:predicted metalloprotease